MFLKVSSHKKWGNVFLNNFQNCIYGFHCVAKNRRMMKDLHLNFWLDSQIWLNVPRDDCPFLLHLPMDDNHFSPICSVQKSVQDQHCCSVPVLYWFQYQFLVTLNNRTETGGSPEN
jgi:hypothetical protein